MASSPLSRPPLLPLALVALLSACTAPATSPEARAGRRPLAVVTTFVPVTLFTRAVAGHCATVTSLIPAHKGPHDFQARPADLAALAQAQVLVKNGLAMETFLERLVAAAQNPQLQVIDASGGITPLPSPGQAHAGPPAAPDKHNHDILHGPDDHQNHAHAHGEANPHVWLDPLRAAEQVAAIRDGLVRADPGCAPTYRRNAAAYIDQLQSLNGEIAAQLRPYRGKSFVAFHDFAPYFANRYGLKAQYLVDVPELNPSPAALQRVAAMVQRSQLRALLSELQEGNRSFNALARDLGVTISEFDPLETASDQAARDPNTYFRVMRRNTAQLRQAFRP